MNHTFKIISWFVVFLIAGNSFGQKKLMKQANSLYAEKKYREAYNIYSKLYDKTPNRETLLKMAECNYNFENHVTAQKYYSEFFKDTAMHPMLQYENFAKSCKITGKIDLAAKTFEKLYKADGNNQTAKYNYEMCQLFLDSANSIRVFSLDSNYNCISLDASESVDSMAAPHNYVWDMGDGSFVEGVTVNYCYKNEGDYKISLNVRDKITGTLKYNDTALSVQVHHSILHFESKKKGKLYFFEDFTSTDSTIANCSILEYFWQTGDGTTVCNKKIKHKYL